VAFIEMLEDIRKSKASTVVGGDSKACFSGVIDVI